MSDLRAMAEADERETLDAGSGGEGTALDVETAIRNGFAAADVAESPVPASMDVPAHVAWSRVMGEVLFIAKADRTTSGSTYNYRGVDRVTDTVAPMLRKHGVIVVPVKVRADYSIINTRGGSAMNYCRATVSFVVMGPRGDVLSMPHPETGIVGAVIGEAIGEGFDSGDKSSMKAQSVAYREFLIKALAIPVTRPQADPEHGEQHEIAGPRKPTPAEYMGEILDEATSVKRLSMIMAELDHDRQIGATVVELAGGEEIRLADLVRRVGRERQARQ